MREGLGGGNGTFSAPFIALQPAAAAAAGLLRAGREKERKRVKKREKERKGEKKREKGEKKREKREKKSEKRGKGIKRERKKREK